MSDLWERLRRLVEPAESLAAVDAEEARLRFREYVAAVAEELPFIDSVSEAPAGELALELEAGGEPWTLFLDNLYKETRELSLEARLERCVFFLSSLADRDEQPSSWYDASRQVLPLLRAASAVRAAGRGIVWRPIAPGLVACVGLDLPRSITYVGQSQLDSWQVGEEELFRVAERNLAERVHPEEIQDRDPESPYPIFTVDSEDDYQSSRLLLPGWLAGFRGHVEGDPVAAVPERGQLVVAGADNDLAIERLLDLAEREYDASPRRISPALYTVDEHDRVVPFEPEVHPLTQQLQRNHRVLALTEYEQQQPALEARLAAAGRELLVAAYTLVENDEESFSYCVWGEGVDSLLPRTDWVVLAGLSAVGGTAEDKNRWFARVRWNDLQRVATGCLRLEPSSSPERYHTRRWPDSEELEELRSLAAD